jgi:hypothetical protein
MRSIALPLVFVVLTFAGTAQAQQELVPPPLVGAPSEAPAAATDVTVKSAVQLETKGRAGLFVAGLAVATLGYVEAFAYATLVLRTPDPLGIDKSTEVLYVPLVGPLISQVMFSNCDRCGGSLFGNSDPFRLITTITSTTAQVLGLVFALIGGFHRSPVQVDQPGLSLQLGAPGTSLGMTLVIRN